MLRFDWCVGPTGPFAEPEPALRLYLFQMRNGWRWQISDHAGETVDAGRCAPGPWQKAAEAAEQAYMRLRSAAHVASRNL